MTILDRRAALVGFGAAAAMPLPSQAFPFRRFLTRAFLACVALWWLTAGAGAQAIEGFPGAVTVAVDRGKGWDFQVALILGLIGESGPAVVLLSQQAVYGPDQTTLPRSIRTSGLIGGDSHYDGQVLEVAGISVAAPHDGGLPLDLVAVGLGWIRADGVAACLGRLAKGDPVAVLSSTGAPPGSFVVLRGRVKSARSGSLLLRLDRATRPKPGEPVFTSERARSPSGLTRSLGTRD